MYSDGLSIFYLFLLILALLSQILWKYSMKALGFILKKYLRPDLYAKVSGCFEEPEKEELFLNSTDFLSDLTLGPF